jgi:hypothetical protein
MQSITMTSPRSSSLFPPLTARLIATALMAGLAADLTWEVWARVLTPLVPGVGGPLEPAALVQSVFGLESRLAGEIIHFVVGVAFYPIGYLFVARPLQRLIIPALPWFVTALGFGAGLFVFALYIMAHLIAGFPAFLGWVPLAWCSLFGHLLFGLVVGFVVLVRERADD